MLFRCPDGEKLLDPDWNHLGRPSMTLLAVSVKRSSDYETLAIASKNMVATRDPAMNGELEDYFTLKLTVFRVYVNLLESFEMTEGCKRTCMTHAIRFQLLKSLKCWLDVLTKRAAMEKAEAGPQAQE